MSAVCNNRAQVAVWGCAECGGAIGEAGAGQPVGGGGGVEGVVSEGRMLFASASNLPGC